MEVKMVAIFRIYRPDLTIFRQNFMVIICSKEGKQANLVYIWIFDAEN